MEKISVILILLFFCHCNNDPAKPEPAATVSAEFLATVIDKHGVPYTCGYICIQYSNSSDQAKNSVEDSDLSATRSIDQNGMIRFKFPAGQNIMIRDYRLLDHLFREIS
jgi:hypothetical protein